jgi:hypothetical protein
MISSRITNILKVFCDHTLFFLHNSNVCFVFVEIVILNFVQKVCAACEKMFYRADK